MEQQKTETPSLDPLQRVFVPREARTSKGTLVFRTQDNQVYARVEGTIHRANKKVRGKAARREDKRLRRAAKA